ncbi:MAG: putative LPS assembly protein LptD [Thiolinea sp.]
MRKTRDLGLLAVTLSIGSPALAATQDWICPVTTTPQPSAARSRALLPADVQQGAVYIEADQALFRESGLSRLEGQVLIAYKDTLLQADRADFRRSDNQVSAEGAVYLISPGLELRSDGLQYNLDQGSGTIRNAEYQLPEAGGRGDSRELVRDEQGVSRLRDASFTTCPPGSNSWSIQARDIELDPNRQQGTARNLSFNVNGRPLFYLPYFSFPLSDQRKSGLLTPGFTTDEKSGVRISLPYYLNLAPNYDMTLTAHAISKRGLQLDSEFRYLLPKHDGRLNYEFLPSDNNRNGRNRYYFDLEHYSAIPVPTVS